FIGASTRIVDRETGEIFRGEVPAYSVVVPGSLPGKATKQGNWGPNLYCAVIVKRVDETTRANTSINALLRDLAGEGASHNPDWFAPGIRVKSSPWETNEGSSHVNDATAVLFPRPPEPQTLLDDGDRYDGGLHPSALACPGHDSRVRARVPPCDDS